MYKLEGNKLCTRLDGHLHSFNDQPAKIDIQTGEMIWMNRGLCHRSDDLPACVIVGKSYEWWVNGQQDRRNGKPAVVTDNIKEWITDGLMHRDNGQPAVIWYNGDMEYCEKGQRHRIGGPAIVLRGHQIYYENDRWLGHHSNRGGWLTAEESDEAYRIYRRKRTAQCINI